MLDDIRGSWFVVRGSGSTKIDNRKLKALA